MAQREGSLAGRQIPAIVGARGGHSHAFGGMQTLSIPTVLYRQIQQALLQVHQPIVEPTFCIEPRLQAGAQCPSSGSCGQSIRAGRPRVGVGHGRGELLRPGQSRHPDVAGNRHVDDERVLKLIRRYPAASLMRDGVATVRDQGTPHGGPLSPLLSNILLTDWDRELEKRGHAIYRFADDFNMYVRSHAAGQSVIADMHAFLQERLRLQVNEVKSARARPRKRKFPGCTLTNAGGRIRLKLSPQSVARLTGRVLELLRQGRGRSLIHTIKALNPVLRGRIGYFRFSQSKTVRKCLVGWLRRRLPCRLWRHARTRQRRTEMLRKRGLPEELA